MEFVQSQHSVYPSKYAIADVMVQLKSQSFLVQKVYFKENVFWSRGYFVSSVDLDEEEFQGRQDLG